MKGLIEIFRAGVNRDATGTQHSFTNEQVAQLAANYDPAYFEAPIVVGHPADNAPAYGWVEKLVAEGPKLLASFKQVDPGFSKLVEQGRFKNRSVSFYKDLGGKGLSLRHVGFLGARAPAIKGLAPIKFQEGDFETFELSEKPGGGSMDIKEIKKVIDAAFENFSEKLKSLVGAGGGGDAAAKPAGGDEVDQKIKAAVDAAKQEFSEKLAAESKKLAAAQDTARRAEITRFAEKMRGQGKWPPAFDKAGLVELMESLDSANIEAIEFGEGEDKKKLSQLSAFQGFIERLPTIVHFGELTGDLGSAPSKVVAFNQSGRPADNIDLAERAEKISREKKIDYGEALIAARSEQSA